MGAGAITVCHNRAAVHIEDVKRMALLPMLKHSSPATTTGKKIFGVSLLKLRDLGLVEDGVPVVVRSMVEFLKTHGLHQEGIFRVNGSVRVVNHLRQRLDAGDEVDLHHEADTFDVASLLKQFLRDLPDGLINSSILNPLIQLHQERSDEDFCEDLCDLLHQLSDIHYSLLRYLCHFLSQVERQHAYNRMTANNLATVFGPNVFHVSSGIDSLREQNICNSIMAKLILNHDAIFGSTESTEDRIEMKSESSNLHMVKDPQCQTDNPERSRESESSPHNPVPLPRKKKVKKAKTEPAPRSFPQPAHSGSPRTSSFPPHSPDQSGIPGSDCMKPTDNRPSIVKETFSGFYEDERPISPFFISSQMCPGHYRPDLTLLLEKTIRSAVEQHLFTTRRHAGQSSEVPKPTHRLLSPVSSARERRRHLRDQMENSRVGGDKENIPSSGVKVTEEDESPQPLPHEGHRSRKPKHTPTLSEWCRNQDASNLMEYEVPIGIHEENATANTMLSENWENHLKKMEVIQTPAMKILEALSGAEPCDDVPRLDLSALTDDSNWAEPVPAYSSWHRESMDREEARVSPHVGGKLIRQLLEEDSDPMVSPRFYAYGDGQQYLDDTEVPPSPPNAHSFVRRRSSSLGSCEDDREELTSAQLSKRIHILKKKIHRFEEKFEDDRKYRPSHSDKAANPEVLRWMNELAKLRKDLKDQKLLKSEEDLTPIPRQRSNTLPKSFGSQLEKKAPETKAPKPPVENTLETVVNKLQEKRRETGRPEDIKDMTREQIGAEKVALQKALLYYENIHGRPVTKSERQVMKPLYDRYRLVKQILCRASAIPVIGSPSSKRRGPLLQPIIEGVPALFFSDTKEEEDGSDDDDAGTQFTLTVKPDLSMLGLLNQLDEDADGFISPVDELSPSKNTTDMRLSNLHAATMQELVEQLQEAREEKKRIRKNLREFEDQFFKQNGRNVQKEDRSPLAGEYNEYKHIKAKLKLLEVLISKGDSSKFI